MDLNVVRLCARSLNPSDLCHKFGKEILSEVVKAHDRFLLGELLRILEGKSHPSRDKVREAFFISLFGLNHLWTSPSLWVLQIMRGILVTLPAS